MIDRRAVKVRRDAPAQLARELDLSRAARDRELLAPLSARIPINS